MFYETKVKDKSNHNLENVAENILSIRAISQTVENPSSSSIYIIYGGDSDQCAYVLVRLSCYDGGTSLVVAVCCPLLLPRRAPRRAAHAAVCNSVCASCSSCRRRHYAAAGAAAHCFC